jgi:TolA-binding protein
MVGAIGNVSASSATPLSVRASAAAGILAQETSASPAQPSTQISDIISSNTDAKLPLYNSIQFIYKQDYGRVVLLEQQPDTGQEITQVPSQYRLQQYQATIRAQRRSQLQKLLGADEGQVVKHGGTQGAGAAAATGSKPSGTTAPAPAPQTAPAPQAAPQVSAPAAAVAHVDIRV